jgi:hypothetical protein
MKSSGEITIDRTARKAGESLYSCLARNLREAGFPIRYTLFEDSGFIPEEYRLRIVDEALKECGAKELIVDHLPGQDEIRIAWK